MKRIISKHVQSLFAVAALVVSLIALFQANKLASYSSTSNIQIDKIEARQSTSIDSLKDYLNLQGDIVLKNFGQAPAQIVSVQWRPLSEGDFDLVDDPWLAFTDRTDYIPGDQNEFYYNRRLNPEACIQTPEIPAGKKRTFHYAFFAGVDVESRILVPNIEISLRLSDGSSLSFLPNIKSYGVSGSW